MNLSDPNRPVLFLGAHPDDEIGCGGTIRRLIREGREIFYAYMSRCEESTKALGFEPDQLIKECHASCETLGIRQENIIGFDFPVRHLPRYRQEILEELVKIRSRINPSLVLVASRNDLHQDHHAVSLEAIRAFKHSSIVGYEFPWNNLESRLDLLISLDQEDIDAKIRSWNCYASQRSRSYHGDELLLSLAKIRGLQASVPLAESFEVIRLVT